MRILSTLLLIVTFMMSVPAINADTLVWRGPTHTMTIGLTEEDISHIEFPEAIANITVENQDYVDILVVEGYNNRAFRMRSMLPKMATRVFFTGASGNTYIVVLTTDVPYKAFLEIVSGEQIDNLARKAAKKFGPHDFIRAMASDTDIPGVVRETFVVPNWFQGAGLEFDLAEVWQSAQLTGVIVHARNIFPAPNEVNIPSITIPQTDEWGTLRFGSMENMRLNARGREGDAGVMYLVFAR